MNKLPLSIVFNLKSCFSYELYLSTKSLFFNRITNMQRKRNTSKSFYKL